MSEPPDARENRIRFHCALLAVLLPLFTLPFVWLLAFRARARARSERGSLWAELLVGLAMLDTLVAAALALVVGGVISFDEPAGPRWVLGVNIDAEDDLRVVAVAEGRAADLAGIEVGDALVAVDGVPVRSIGELRAELDRGEEAYPRTLLVVRGDGSLELEVTPEPPPPPEEAPPPPDLFEVLEGGERAGWLLLPPPTLAILAGGLLALWAWCRPRGGDASIFAPAFGAYVAAELVGATLFAVSFHARGGWTHGGSHVSSLARSVCLVAVCALVLAHRRPDAAERPTGSLTVVLALGAAYVAALGPRVAAATGALVELLALGGVELPYEDVLPRMLGPSLPDAARWLSLATIVVAAPAAEEFLFRGLIQPWLRRFVGPVKAVVGASLLFGLMHYHYGLMVTVPVVYGLVLGWARERTGGLAAPILLHMGINAYISWSWFD